MKTHLLALIAETAVAVSSLLAVNVAEAAEPSAITVGCLYAGSGFLAAQSKRLHDGLQFWVSETQAAGGVYVKAVNKKLPIKLQCYNDQSSPSLVTTLTNQLIDQKVNILVADASSLLTAPSVPVAQERKQLLFNPTGTSEKFFSDDNPYIVQAAVQVTKYWAQSIAEFVKTLPVKRVAVLYDTNDFDAPQAALVKKDLEAAKIDLVYYNGTQTETPSYVTLINTIAAAKPDAVIQLGYGPNDVSFLRDLENSGTYFPLVYNVFPGILPESFKTQGAGLRYTYTYVTLPTLDVKDVNEGLTSEQFMKTYKERVGHVPNMFEASGYVTGLVIQRALEHANNLEQLALRNALTAASGKMKTLAGPFEIRKDGSQYGVISGIAQFQPKEGREELVVVYPKQYATGKPMFPAPKK